MNNLRKFELMEKIVRQLQDLQHSQQAIIEKVGKVEIDNFDLNDKNLAKVLSDIHQYPSRRVLRENRKLWRKK